MPADIDLKKETLRRDCTKHSSPCQMKEIVGKKSVLSKYMATDYLSVEAIPLKFIYFL